MFLSFFLVALCDFCPRPPLPLTDHQGTHTLSQRVVITFLADTMSIVNPPAIDSSSIHLASRELCFLVRHPESQSNVLYTENKEDTSVLAQMNQLGNADLTSLGKKQAWKTARALSVAITAESVGSVRICRSPMRRTGLLATCTSNFLGSLGHQGGMEPRGVDIIPELVEYNPPAKVNDFPKDGSSDDFYGRVHDFYNDAFTKDREPEARVIIGHSLFLSTLISIVTLHALAPLMTRDEVLHHLTTRTASVHDVVFHLPNCSVTTLQRHDGAWRILNVASTAHLPVDLVTGTHCEFR